MKDVTVVVIDSRSKRLPHWVQGCIQSVMQQTVPVKLIVVENTDLDKTIGLCWNEAVKQCDTEWVFFVGDDSYLARDCVQVMLNHSSTPMPCVTTFMTMFNDKAVSIAQRPHTGMWRREYLLKYPFNEKLERGIDREYFQEAVKRGDGYYVIPYYFGLFDRRHDNQCSGKVVLELPEDKQDIYVTCSGGVNFVSPLVSRWRNQGKRVMLAAQPFEPLIKTDIIWCEWANENAKIVADFETDAKKFLRFHSFEAYSPYLYYIDFKKFDKIFFIADHVKNYVESKIGVLDNAVVVPVGVDVDKFKFIDRERNNKICYAGEISRKKGIGELFLIANSLPEYEFHIAGKFNEDDVARYFYEQKPDNVFLYPYSYNLNEFFKDKSYFISPSLREGVPITVLEASATGIRPIVNNYIGAKETFGWYVYNKIDDIKRMLEEPFDSKEYRALAEKFDFNKTVEILNGYL